ncbi:hypothetical protein F5148DRAFT_974063 [Russula earlei]|uniref:Uncharacterized protein n=1 Tax=Russula earlei TaxID=71964 RepID=A0ACC0UKA7_9AGAM|nr:hypothetical protein F5148DRAFT_974063 [Russula earlei]
MEKYSAFRDPGTGIQPFLTPVPPLELNMVARITLPLSYILAVVRTTLIMVIAAVYVVFVSGVCTVLRPIPPIHGAISYFSTALLSRLSLFILGVLWIPVEEVSRKRGRSSRTRKSWHPDAGDLIVSNWASWIETLWLAFRFDPIFVLPVSDVPVPQQDRLAETRATGRRTGTGSAAISLPAKPAVRRANIVGFRKVSLLNIILHTGNTPLDASGGNFVSLEEIRSSANRPVVVFPECTTSNGRGLLQFAELFKDFPVPVKGYKVFIMCVRYDPPTALSPTLSRSIPSRLNPLPHIFSLTRSLQPLTLSIRLLPHTESPSSPSFIASEVVSGDIGEDTFTAVCSVLVSQLGKLKKTNLSWEDKVFFLKLYREKQGQDGRKAFPSLVHG